MSTLIYNHYEFTNNDEKKRVPPWLVTDLNKILRNDCTMTQLHIRYRYIGPGGAEAVRHVLMNSKCNGNLEKITVGGMGPVATKTIVEGVCSNASLQEVHIEFFSAGQGEQNKHNDDVPDLLGQKMGTNNCNINVLRLFWSRIGSRGLQSIAHGLAVNTSLVVLNLSHNGLGNEGTKLLSATLVQNSTLRGLYLQQNQIGQGGGVALAQALEHNSTVEILSLDGNPLLLSETDHCVASAFCRVLERRNTTLKWIYIDPPPSDDDNKTLTTTMLLRRVGYWCALNRAHRKHIWTESLSHALWPAILAKVSNHPALLYGFLRDKPDLFVGLRGHEHYK